MAGVDRQDWYADRRRLASRREHRAIAAEHDRQLQVAAEAGGHTGRIAQGAQVLVRVGEAHHAAGAAHPQHVVAGRR